MAFNVYVYIGLTASLAGLMGVIAMWINKRESSVVFADATERVDFRAILTNINHWLKNDGIEELIDLSRSNDSVEKIYLYQVVICAVLTISAYFFLDMLAPNFKILTLPAVWVGFQLPIWNLQSEVKKRIKTAEKESYMFCEYFACALEESQHHIDALKYICQERSGVLYSEIQEALNAMQYGVNQVEAFDAIIRYLNSSRIKNIVKLVSKSLQTATPMTDELRQQADMQLLEHEKDAILFFDNVQMKLTMVAVVYFLFMCIIFFSAASTQMTSLYQM